MFGMAPALREAEFKDSWPDELRETRMKKYIVSLVAVFLMAVGGTALAQETPEQDQQNQQNEQDQADIQDAATTQQAVASQPSVARIRNIHGDVSVQRGDNGTWVAATVNTPIATGDRISTGPKSAAELQLDSGNVVRMSENATVNAASLTRTSYQVQVGQGLVTYSILRGNEANSEIDTPNVAVHPAGEGEYRIQVNSNSETVVIIRSGAADITTPEGSTRVDSRQMITIQGTDNPQYRVDAARAPDAWDKWNEDRNGTIASAKSWQHTDRYYTGTEDLDGHGQWTEIPDYGQVWTPNVDPGWAPYRAGSWVYQPYYGWTWVSYEPWGWAPYHYGRWFVYGGNWVWWPGPVVAYPAYRPIWAPAYVSFFGFGGGGFGIGFGFGFGFGSVGWLAVGPGDWYHPWYGRWGGRANTGAFANINSVHSGFGPLARNGAHPFSNAHEALTNARVRGGMSSMASNQFGRGAVPTHQQGISEGSLRQANMMTGKMPVSPTKASYSATNHAANPATVRSGSPSSQHFFSSRANGTANAGHQTAAAAGSNRPGSTFSRPSSNATSGNRTNTSAPSQSSTTRTETRSLNLNGAASAGRTSAASTQHQNSTTAQSGRGGWSTFGSPSRQSTATTSRGNSAQSGRPSLNMSQPVVRPRSTSPYGSSGARPGSSTASNGGYRGAPPSGAARPATGGSPHSSPPSHSSGGHSGGGHSH
jgi:hypothetical protein